MNSFSDADQIRIPYNKIVKTINKQIGAQGFQLQPVEGLIDTYSQSKIFSIQSDTSISGYVYVSRVNSCRSGGCSIMPDDIALEFEYFDYFFITDSIGNVLNVKVYNYQATHGHQVMSKGWLKQFIGFSGKQSLNYGKDIQAISGATISAQTLIHDLEQAEGLIQSLLNN
jgi:hypothetical protein|tara:strand:- start:1523 stop:2032 length:510 start_codon:yes stop_codon:yes gene_type:complete